MRAIVVLTAIVAVLAPATADAKVAPVVAAEICGVGGCRPVEDAALELTSLVPEAGAAVADGARHLDAPHETPSLRIRLWLDDPHTSRPFRSSGLDPVGMVEIDYAPSIRAVRIVTPPSKPHWARIDEASARALDRLADGVTPVRLAADRRVQAGATAQLRGDRDRGGDAGPRAAGLALLALAGAGAVMARRRLG